MTEQEPLRPRIPVSTYRLQFNHQFTFSAAKKIVPYLGALGISDLYASPYLMAKAGSLHGYDIVDPHQLNPEIGTEEDYSGLIDALHRHGMGQILDIVPNHMCVTSPENRWWMDVLENGPSSLYARFFDIDWNPVKKELRNKVLLPILGDQYGSVLENGSLRLTFRDGAFFISMGDFRLPIRPQTYVQILEHRLAELESSLPEKDLSFAELLSITTSLNHLPPYTEEDPEKIKERNREKEIVKKRLSNLYDGSPPVRSFIDENIVLFNGRNDQPRSFDLLDRLLGEQAYRLSYWRVAAEEINYRRFFDVNDLAALRPEDPQVFEETHRLIFELIGKGMVTGLRVDHPDGLYNPAEYFTRLQQFCAERTGSGGRRGVTASSDAADKPFYIVGEKILIKGERMPDDWPIYSTTGYVFMNSVNGIFVQPDHVKAIDQIYTKFIKRGMDFQETIYEKKKLVMQIALSSEINTLGHSLDGLSEKSRHTRDFTLYSLVSAIIEVIAFFPVYRTYIDASGVNDRDRKYIELAVSKAQRKNPGMSESVFNFFKDVLLLKFPETLEEEDKKEWLHFVMRVQQVTGPVMAKGIEDTTFYVYNRFVSLNEVGGSPDRFGISLETFHGQNIERNKFWPHALIATSTHDSKRSEDVRVRINVLSEIPAEWRERVFRWVRINRKKKPAADGLPVPGPNEEYLLYQTLIGAWPVDPGAAADPAFKNRITDYMIKAVREAKVDTSWINPNRPYEEALVAFIERILGSDRDNLFLQDFVPFQKKVSQYGMFNSLSQTLLKITVPGVPDFFQGTELWSFDLVDPDNRRPVDYNKRTEMLDALKRRESEIPWSELCRELLVRKDDGRIKLYLTYKALTYRREHRALFEQGEYIPLEVRGERADHVCAFERRTGDSGAIVLAPRFYTGLAAFPDGLPLGPEAWKDTAVLIPSAVAGSRFRNVLTGEELTVDGGGAGGVLALSDVMANFPVALLEKRDSP